MGNVPTHRLARSAVFLTAATAVSRVLGLVREMVMVAFLGLGPAMGAFTVAFKIPSLVRTLVADTALSAAFVPVFSELLAKGNRREAWQLASTVTLLAATGLGVVSVLGMLWAPQLVSVVAPGFADPETIKLTIDLTRIMFPSVAVLGLAGIFMGILNSHDHFALPALAPLAWNVVIIAAVVVGVGWLGRGQGFYALAWGVMAGTVVELLIQIPAVWRRRKRAAGLMWRHPAVRRFFVLLGPVVLSLGIINFNALVATIFASLVSESAPAYVDKAFRLFQLPQGMFAVAIGTVLFPRLSRLAATARFDEFRATMNVGLRQIFFITLPFTAFFVVLGEPTVRLIFERGMVTALDTQQVAWALMFFSVGMAFVSANTLLNRGFYGIQKSWIPLVVGVANLALNALLNFLLYKPLGVGGITLATSLVSTFNFFALIILLAKYVGSLHTARLLGGVAKSIACMVPLVVLGYGSWWLLDHALGRTLAAQLLAVGVAYVVGFAAYGGSAKLLGMKEIDEVLKAIRRRGGRAEESGVPAPGSETGADGPVNGAA